MHENNLQLSSRTGQAARPRASRSIRHQLRSASTEHARGLLHGPRTSVDRALYKKRSQRFNHRSPDCGHDLTLKYHADQQHDAKATAAARTAARGAPLSDWPHSTLGSVWKVSGKSPAGARGAARARPRGAGRRPAARPRAAAARVVDCRIVRAYQSYVHRHSITNCSRQGQRPQSTESTHGPTHWTLQPHVPDNTSRDGHNSALVVHSAACLAFSLLPPPDRARAHTHAH
jgi:hypothetical protein